MPLVVPAQRQPYTVEEVLKHNTASSLWVIMNRKVYDVTAFHKKHPGGPGVLLQMGGKDATAAAAAAHKSILPANLMWEFCIGYIVRVKPDETKKEEAVAKTASGSVDPSAKAKRKKSAVSPAVGEDKKKDQVQRKSPPSFIEDVERMLSRPVMAASKSSQELSTPGISRSSIPGPQEAQNADEGEKTDGEAKLERTFTTIMEEMDSEIVTLNDDDNRPTERNSAPSAGIGLLCFMQGNACWSHSSEGLSHVGKVA